MSRWARRVASVEERLTWPDLRRLSVVLLAALAYLPAVFSSPGRMPADTKLFLYLNPGGLMDTASQAWDTSQFGGWVPHQTIAYLWPTGPWFWVGEHLGLPVWLVHRLWIGTLLFMGGWGVLRLARTLGLSATGALVAAVLYQLSPFTLPYVSRTSVMLLPWAGLGWLTLLTIRSFRSGGWRYPAIFALVVVTVAGVNATAFLMIVPGPVAWVLIEWVGRRLDTRRVLAASGRLAVLSAAVSLWWVTMLSVQGTNGADVLAYSETLDAVSLTSTSVEVMRSLGYWLFYIRDPYAAATTSSIRYQNSLPLIAVGFGLLLICCLGLVLTRWPHRRFAVALVALGVVMSVGVHPFADPAPLLGLLRDSDLGLALRSSTRALPLLALGLGLSAGALVAAVGVRWPQRRLLAGVLVILVACLNMPSTLRAELVDPALTRDQDPPAAWQDAAADLDAGVLTNRVLQLPGSEFGAFRWGYTVDPVLPGITDKPLITRDLLPLGSPGVMDLLFALDNRVQSGTLDMASLAPVSRLLAADRIWISNDLAFDRFRTPRPERFLADLLAADEGLGKATSYGTPVVNQPDVPMVDEQSLSDDLVGVAIAPVTVREVNDPVPMARIGSRVVILDGSGDGVVNAAAAGLLEGDEVIFYANDLPDDRWQSLADGAPMYIVTDSNRDRDQQWRGSQDALGMTESGGPSQDGITDDAGDVRLPLFDEPGTIATQTTAHLENGLVVQASSYGEPFAFMPEDRAAMAVDGDVATAWRTGDRWNLIGQSITVSQAADGELRLVQAQGRELRFMITSVDITVNGAVQHVDLTDASLTEPGQVVVVPSDGAVTVTIASVGPRPNAPPTGEYWVGFAELGPTATEFVQPPATLLEQLPNDSNYAIVFHREHVRGTDRWRSDPEPRLLRRFSTNAAVEGTLALTLQLNSRAPDDVLNRLAGWDAAPIASDRLTGVPGAAATAAFDDDTSTRWMSAFNTAIGTSLDVPIDAATPLTSFSISQTDLSRLSRITEVLVSVGDVSTVLSVPVPDADGLSRLDLPQAVAGDQMTIEVTGVENRFTTDRRYGHQVVLPVGISEISGLPTRATRVTPQESCRDDLLTIDGKAVPLRVDMQRLLAGEAVDTATCDGEPLRLAAGAHTVASSSGLTTGIDVNDVSISNGALVSSTGPRPSVATVQNSDTSFTMQVSACPSGCWLIFGQGNNSGWAATTGGLELGASQPVSGGFAGWWLPPSDTESTVDVVFTPQRRLTMSLWVSGLAVLICLALVIVRRPRAPNSHASASAAYPVTLVVPWQGKHQPPQWVAAGVVIIAAALLISPMWAVPATVVGAVLVWSRRPRAVAIAGIVGIAFIGAMVLRRQWAYRYPASAAWPGNFEGLHGFGLFSILILSVAFFARDAEAVPTTDDANDLDGIERGDRTPP